MNVGELVPADSERRGVPVCQHRGHLHAQPDGARPEEGLPGHQELHRRQTRDGG